MTDTAVRDSLSPSGWDSASGSIPDARGPRCVEDSSSGEAVSEMSDAWIETVYEPLFRSAWAMTGDATVAEDLVQETFLVALERWETFEGRSNRMTWLYGVLIRMNRKRFRALERLRKRLERYGVRSSRAKTESDASEQIALQEWNESLWSEVRQLPRVQAEAITLRFAAHMTYEQVAEAMESAVGTAKTRVFHGLKQLRECSDIDPNG